MSVELDAVGDVADLEDRLGAAGWSLTSSRWVSAEASASGAAPGAQALELTLDADPSILLSVEWSAPDAPPEGWISHAG
ncbi:hypothetical protein ACH436_09470 [Isoptericola sp. NPDC019693]|uniref:hypothetical protein n=1 Tax=Isoptericola sp. NPDC019693 TaxID=3364009 RepID=UPI0037B7BC21